MSSIPGTNAKLSYAMAQIERVIRLAKSGYYGRNTGRKPQAIHLWSRPGEGKTASVIAMCKRMGIPVRVVALANHDPTDLKGLGWVDEKGNTRWSRPADIIPTKEEVDAHGGFLILWDDIVTAPPGLQALTYDALDRWQLGPHEIDHRVVQVSTGNRATDRAFVNPMPSALGNRILQLTVENNADDWLDWAIGEGVNPLIGAWVARFKEGSLRSDPVQGEAWLSPRSLWNLDRYLQATAQLENRDVVYEPEIVRGFIGNQKGQELLTYSQHQKLIDLVDLIPSGKLTWDRMQKEAPGPDQKYVLAIAAVQKCKAEEFCPWILQWGSDRDIAAFAVKQFSKSKPAEKPKMTRYMPEMHKKFGTLIQGVFDATK